MRTRRRKKKKDHIPITTFPMEICHGVRGHISTATHPQAMQLCTDTHRAIVSCSNSPSPGEAAGEPSGDEPNNCHVNVQSAYTEWTWGGEAGVCTICSTLDIVSNKSFHNLSENITSPRNGVLITSLRSFSKACNVYFDPHHHTQTNSNTTFPWKH